MNAKKKYNLKKKPKKQISFRLKEETIDRLKDIEKYHSKIDTIINLGITAFVALENGDINDASDIKVVRKEDFERFNKELMDLSDIYAEYQKKVFILDMRKSFLEALLSFDIEDLEKINLDLLDEDKIKDLLKFNPLSIDDEGNYKFNYDDLLKSLKNK